MPERQVPGKIFEHANPTVTLLPVDCGGFPIPAPQTGIQGSPWPASHLNFFPFHSFK